MKNSVTVSAVECVCSFSFFLSVNFCYFIFSVCVVSCTHYFLSIEQKYFYKINIKILYFIFVIFILKWFCSELGLKVMQKKQLNDIWFSLEIVCFEINVYVMWFYFIQWFWTQQQTTTKKERNLLLNMCSCVRFLFSFWFKFG